MRKRGESIWKVCAVWRSPRSLMGHAYLLKLLGFLDATTTSWFRSSRWTSSWSSHRCTCAAPGPRGRPPLRSSTRATPAPAAVASAPIASPASISRARPCWCGPTGPSAGAASARGAGGLRGEEAPCAGGGRRARGEGTVRGGRAPCAGKGRRARGRGAVARGRGAVRAAAEACPDAAIVVFAHGGPALAARRGGDAWIRAQQLAEILPGRRVYAFACSTFVPQRLLVRTKAQPWRLWRESA